MRLNGDDLDAISVFVAVVEAKGLRAAGDRLGVSGSAVSQALRGLEEFTENGRDLSVDVRAQDKQWKGDRNEKNGTKRTCSAPFDRVLKRLSPTAR